MVARQARACSGATPGVWLHVHVDTGVRFVAQHHPLPRARANAGVVVVFAGSGPGLRVRRVQTQTNVIHSRVRTRAGPDCTPSA